MWLFLKSFNLVYPRKSEGSYEERTGLYLLRLCVCWTGLVGAV